MIRETMDEEIHFTDLVRENKLDVILDWLTKRDFANDWMEPGDWIKKITGKELTSAPYITYLTNKYGENAGK
jgi:Zn-dependent M32 family carboxypeptidase